MPGVTAEIQLAVTVAACLPDIQAGQVCTIFRDFKGALLQDAAWPLAP